MYVLGHLYRPETESCHPAFRQGSCNKGFMLALVSDNVIPQCIRNRCEDGSVEIKERCYKFGESDYCSPKEAILGVNESFQIICIPVITDSVNKPCSQYKGTYAEVVKTKCNA